MSSPQTLLQDFLQWHAREYLQPLQAMAPLLHKPASRRRRRADWPPPLTEADLEAAKQTRVHQAEIDAELFSAEHSPAYNSQGKFRGMTVYALRILADGELHTTPELARATGETHNAMSHALNRIYDAGLVNKERVVNSTTKRKLTAYRITDRGRRFLDDKSAD